MAQPFEVQLGDLARDRLTGFQGVVVGITSWINSCRHVGIKPQTLDKNGEPRECKWFDEPQVDVVEPEHFRPDPVDPAATGGPVPDGLA
jgi:hypothetical protein